MYESYTHEDIYEMIIWIIYMNSYTYKFIYNHVYEFKCIDSGYRFWIRIWLHKCIRIHLIQSEFINLISLLSIHYWKSMRIQYSEFMILNSVVKYRIWIHCNAFKRITLQISDMYSFMNWILMNSQILFHGRIYGFI